MKATCHISYLYKYDSTTYHMITSNKYDKYFDFFEKKGEVKLISFQSHVTVSTYKLCLEHL